MIFQQGASDDIQRATKIARSMVTKYGMSERIGTITLGQGQEEVFLGRDLAHAQEYSEETAAIIDEETKRIVDQGYNRAKQILTQNIDKLHKVAGVLLEKKKKLNQKNLKQFLMINKIKDCLEIDSFFY